MNTTCPECLKNDYEKESQKLEAIITAARKEAAGQNYEQFAIVRTINANPGYMWRPIGHEDIARLGAVGYYTSY